MLKKSQKNGRQVGMCLMWGILILLVMSLTAVQTNAGIFYDDFEDGDHVGWSYANTGGTGSSGVNLNGGVGGDPDNHVAWASQSSLGTTALSQDFNYVPTADLMFDMQLRANRSSSGTNAWSGVTMTFRDSLNFKLGELKLFFGSDGTGNVSDQNWHSYSATMLDLANMAGVISGKPTKLSLSFWAQAQNTSYAGYYPPSSSVNFDNVQVVPEPATLSLLAFGSLALLRKRK